jgi:hypothetical protein
MIENGEFFLSIFRPKSPTPPPYSDAGSDEEPTQQGSQQVQEMHSSTDHEDDMPLVTTKKAKKSSAKNDWSMKDPRAELDLIEWYKDNTYLWLITDKDYMNHAKKNNALEDKGKELGVTGKFLTLIFYQGFKIV